MAEVIDDQDPATGVVEPVLSEGSPTGSGTSAGDDATAIRVDVRASMAVEAGPWTVAPGDPEAPDVRWLDRARAVVRLANGEPSDVHHVVLGHAGAISSVGVQRREMVIDGWRILLDVQSERIARLRDRARRGREDAAHGGPLEVRAIIPGRVVAVSVSVGDTVVVGQQLLVVEAMKMQNELRATRAGVVERIAVGMSQTIELGALLLVIR